MAKRRAPPTADDAIDLLPAPTTTRVLRTRLQARSNAGSTTASRSPSAHPRSGTSTPSRPIDKGKGKMRDVSVESSTRSSSVASEPLGRRRQTKRIKLDPDVDVKSKGKGKMRAEDVETDFASENEVDQLAMEESETERQPYEMSPTVPEPIASSSTAVIDLLSPETSPIVSSPSLAKLLHPTNYSSSPPQGSPSRSAAGSSTSQVSGSASSSRGSQSSSSENKPSKLDESSLLSAYTCPVCFSPPTNATITPCGHVLCGSCLFAAVKAGLQRNAVLTLGVGQPMCPVCRAPIPGWDGKGGGVIGLKIRAIISV